MSYRTENCTCKIYICTFNVIVHGEHHGIYSLLIYDIFCDIGQILYIHQDEMWRTVNMPSFIHSKPFMQGVAFVATNPYLE